MTRTWSTARSIPTARHVFARDQPRPAAHLAAVPGRVRHRLARDEGRARRAGPFEAARDALEAAATCCCSRSTTRRCAARGSSSRGRSWTAASGARASTNHAALEAFDREHPEPTPAELERSLESLTPPGWEARLEAIVERGLLATGALPAAGAPGG